MTESLIAMLRGQLESLSEKALEVLVKKLDGKKRVLEVGQRFKCRNMRLGNGM